MRFEIPFNETITREYSKKYFDFVWKDNLSKYKRTLYFTIFYIISGIAIICGKSNLGYLFLVFGFCFFIAYFFLIKNYKKVKKRYFINIEKHILEYSSSDKPCVCEFSDEQFHYSDFKYELKINWSSFTKYRIIENNLILELRDNIIATFFLNKEEVGQENFDKIIHFLEGKIKNQ